MPSNLMIANFLVFCSVLCLALSAQLHLMLFVVYLLIALTGFKGQPGENRTGLAIAGVLAGATSVAALYGVYYKAPSIWWLDKVWWLGLIWAVIGVGVVLVAKSRGNLASHAPVVPD